MMNKRIPILLLFVGLLFQQGQAQLKISGTSQTQVYGWENRAENQQWDFYQNFGLRLAPASNPNLYLKTYFRVGRLGDPADWREKIYNASLNWISSNRNYKLRLGRQFVYAGVMNGTVDGLLLNVRPSSKLSLKLLAGMSAPLDRSAGLEKFNDARAIGAYAAYRLSQAMKMDLSYYQTNRSGKLAWQQLGAALSGKLGPNLYYNSVVDYNVLRSDLQGLRLRLTYYVNQWSFSGEFNNQKPRIYEDSFFNIFEIGAYNQVRTAVTYQLGRYLLGLRYSATAYGEGELTNRAELTLSGKPGMIGVLFQNGFSGDNLGLFGELRYELIRNLELRLFSSYYNYEFQTRAISEDATAFSGGFNYRVTPDLMLQAEVQQSLNSYYKNDLRGLFRLNYAFNY